MIEWWQIALLFATGLVAGFVDSIAGGGGLLTLPVFLAICPNAKIALGTNKLQASFGSTSAAFHYARAGAFSARDCARSCLLAFLGSVTGSVMVHLIDSQRLKEFVPFLLIAVTIFVCLQPKLGEKDIHPRMGRLKFDLIFAYGIGFYDGLIGPGTGTFWALAFMLGLGFNLTKATAHSKALNCASNIAALIVFLLAKQVWFAGGIAMGCGQWLGARLGSRMVITRGVKFIRPIFLTMVILVTLKVIWDIWIKPRTAYRP